VLHLLQSYFYIIVRSPSIFDILSSKLSYNLELAYEYNKKPEINTDFLDTDETNIEDSFLTLRKNYNMLLNQHQELIISNNKLLEKRSLEYTILHTKYNDLIKENKKLGKQILKLEKRLSPDA